MLYMSPAVWRYSELLTSHEKSIRFVTDWLAAFTEHLDQPSLYGLAKDYVSYNTFKKELVWNFLKNRTRWEKQQTILHFSIFSLSVWGKCVSSISNMSRDLSNNLLCRNFNFWVDTLFYPRMIKNLEASQILIQKEGSTSFN